MKHRDGILDLVRGTSALLVMLGHLRGFIFVDYGDLERAGILTKLFYFATGLGHQAVMVFFVLSGYFVGGSVVAGLRNGNFTWRGYAAVRLTRLWMVLIPALLLTLCIDLLGRQWNPGAYAGDLHACFMCGPQPGQPAAWDALTLLGNLFLCRQWRCRCSGPMVRCGVWPTNSGITSCFRWWAADCAPYSPSAGASRPVFWLERPSLVGGCRAAWWRAERSGCWAWGCGG